MINFPLLDERIAALKADQERHNQGVWLMWRGAGDPPTHGTPDVRPPCGTGMCLAGDIAWVSGAELGWNQEHDNVWSAEIVLSDGYWMSVSDFAAQRLGLTPAERDALFHPMNTIGEIEQIRNELAGHYNYTEEGAA